MRSLILLLVVGILCSANPTSPQAPAPSDGMFRQHTRDDAARKMIPQDKQGTLLHNPTDLKNKPDDYLHNIDPSTIARLPPDTLQHIKPSQLNHSLSRFQTLGPQNFKNLVQGISSSAFSSIFGGWKVHSGNLTQDQARAIVNRYAQSKGSLSSKDVANLGGLKKGLSRQHLQALSPDAIPDLQDARSSFDSCQRRAVVDVKKKSKLPSYFSSSDMDQLGNFVPDMTNADLKMVPSTAVRGSLKDIGSKSGYRQDQAKTLLDKTRPDAKDFTKDDITKAGNLNSFHSSARLNRMDDDVADEVAKQVKQPRKPTDQTLASHFFGRRAGKVNGTVHTRNLTCDVMSQAAGQVGGLSTREQRGIPKSEFANCVKNLAQRLGNNGPHQFLALGGKIFKNKRNSTFTVEKGREKNVSRMTAGDISGLGHMIKGMRSEQVDQTDGKEFAKAIKMGAKMNVKGAQGSQKRAMLKKAREGGLRKMSDFGSDLAKEIPLGMHQKIPGNFTVMDKQDRDVKLRDSQTADSYERVRKHLGPPGEGNTTKWTASTIRNLGRVMCGMRNDDAENMPADQAETTIDALSQCSGKHGAQMAIVRAHAENQQMNFSQVAPSDVAGFGKLAYNLKVDDIKKMPTQSKSQLCCQVSSNSQLKENAGADKTKFLFDECRANNRKQKMQNRAADMMKECDSSDEVEQLGDLNSGRNEADIGRLCSDTLQNSASFLNKKFNSTQKRALAQNYVRKVRNNDASQMTGDDLANIGDSAKFLSDDQLSKIRPEALGDSLDSMSQVQWSGKQAQTLIPKLEKTFGKNVSMWSGREHRRAGNMTVGLKPDQIRNMKPEAFDDALDSVSGNCERLGDDQKQAIRDAAKMKLGDGSFDRVSEEDISRMGCAGMHSDVINSKNFGSSEEGIHMADEASKRGNVDKATSAMAFQKIKDQRSGKTQGGRTKRAHGEDDVDDWTSQDVANAGSLMRGATLDDVNHMQDSALSGASHVLGRINWSNVSKDVVDTISKKVRKGMSPDGMSDFPANKWGCSHTAEMGSLIRKEDVPHLNKSHIQCIDRETIGNLGSRGSDVLNAFSTDQLKSFDSDKARAIQKTSAYSTFSPEQQDAVTAAASVDALTAEATTEAPTPTDGARTVAASFGGLLVVAAVAFVY